MIFVHPELSERLINFKYFSGLLFVMTPLKSLYLVRNAHVIPPFKSEWYFAHLLGLYIAFLWLVLMPPQSPFHMTPGDLTGLHTDGTVQGVIVQLDHILQHIEVPVPLYFSHIIPQ